MALLVIGACSSGDRLSVRSLSEDRLLAFERLEMKGVRDGNRMEVAAHLAGASGSLDLKMQLAIGVPTRLVTGSFKGVIESQTLEGSVTARSVTFLGGQSDWPNLGGDFLLKIDGRDRFRVRLPVTPVEP